MAYKVKGHVCTPYVISDFETGGLHMDVCGLTEIAMIGVEGDSLNVIDEYESLIKPHDVYVKGEGLSVWKPAVYEPGAEKVTGLTRQFLEANGKDVDEVAKEVQEKLIKFNVHKSRTGYKPVLVAHNAQYEVKCFQNLAHGRFDLSKYFHGDVDFYGNFAPHYIDTLDLAKLLWNANERMKSFKLANVLEAASIPIYDAHRAMNDVRPSTEFFQWVIKLLRAAQKTGILAQSNAEVNEEGKIVRQTGREFKFQIPL